MSNVNDKLQELRALHAAMGRFLDEVSAVKDGFAEVGQLSKRLSECLAVGDLAGAEEAALTGQALAASLQARQAALMKVSGARDVLSFQQQRETLQ
jgi:hypothetical protein